MSDTCQVCGQLVFARETHDCGEDKRGPAPGYEQSYFERLRDLEPRLFTETIFNRSAVARIMRRRPEICSDQDLLEIASVIDEEFRRRGIRRGTIK